MQLVREMDPNNYTDIQLQTAVGVTGKKVKKKKKTPPPTKKHYQSTMRGAKLNEKVIFSLNRRRDIQAEPKEEVGVSPAKSMGKYSREYSILFYSIPWNYSTLRNQNRELYKQSNDSL